MRIRKQLFFISLVTLALPWVGCQTIREMDNSLRQGQVNSLSATSRAVAARIQSDGQLRSILPAPQENDTRSDTDTPFYAHRLHSPLFIDGYDDDWISQGYTFNPLQRGTKNHVVMGLRQSQLHIFVQIHKSPLRYFNPSLTTLDGTDHLILHTKNQSYALFASSPGQALAIRMVDGQKRVNDKTREHQIKAIWLEHPHGYQLEITLPIAWARTGLSIEAFEPTNRSPRPLRPVLTHSETLSSELDVFTSLGTRLHVIGHAGHLIANAGTIDAEATQNATHGFLTWIYSLALGNRQYPQVQGTSLKGSFNSEDILSTLKGETTSRWLLIGNRPLARASSPLIDEKGTVIGAVIAEQSTGSMIDMTDQAFSKLLAYSFLASLFAAVSLVFYANWLSLRIRKLSDAATNAVNENGKITEGFPVMSSADELGDLSRSYSQLLMRLREYTNYLQTLSSKLSHELRTPLAIVRSSLDNLEHERMGKQAKVYADRAREGTTRLSNILNAMSAASRVEQAIGASEREIIPCDELLSNLKDAYEDVYKNVRFNLKLRKDPKGLRINGSGELLVQALDKLVDNAADFCPDQGVIELGLYRHQDSIIFTVHNEGPPLPSHMHGQLFDSMVSVRDKASTEASHHLGLGLYIVRLITDFHSGEVQGYNVADNSGVIFELRLPAC